MFPAISRTVLAHSKCSVNTEVSGGGREMPPMARFSTLFTIIIFILRMETDLGRPSLSKVIRLVAGFEPLG